MESQRYWPKNMLYVYLFLNYLLNISFRALSWIKCASFLRFSLVTPVYRVIFPQKQCHKEKATPFGIQYSNLTVELLLQQWKTAVRFPLNLFVYWLSKRGSLSLPLRVLCSSSPAAFKSPCAGLLGVLSQLGGQSWTWYSACAFKTVEQSY